MKITSLVCYAPREKAELSPTCVSALNGESSVRASNVKKGLERPQPLCRREGAKPRPDCPTRYGSLATLALCLELEVMMGAGRRDRSLQARGQCTAGAPL